MSDRKIDEDGNLQMEKNINKQSKSKPIFKKINDNTFISDNSYPSSNIGKMRIDVGSPEIDSFISDIGDKKHKYQNWEYPTWCDTCNKPENECLCGMRVPENGYYN